jgi:hypothetical protein
LALSGTGQALEKKPPPKVTLDFMKLTVESRFQFCRVLSFIWKKLNSILQRFERKNVAQF